MIYLKVASILRAAGQDCIRLVVARPVDPGDPNQPVSPTFLISNIYWSSYISIIIVLGSDLPRNAHLIADEISLKDTYKVFACEKEKERLSFNAFHIAQ